MLTLGGSRADGIGASPLRKEDRRLVTGQGEFTDDFAPAGHCYAAIVRSPHPHAGIGSIDTAQAATAPGVLAVLTGADLAADGLQPIPHNPDWKGVPDAELRLPSGFEVYTTKHYALAQDRVRYVGEAVAMVVAETAAAAADAAELVEVDYQPLLAVVSGCEALASDAPQLWDDCPGNLALACEVGDKAATDKAFAEAAHIVSLDTWVQRINGVPMEPRTAIGEYDAATGLYTLRGASGRGAVQTRERLAITLGVPKEQCRVVFGDMGGNFGTRNAFSPEYTLMPWAARRVGRPVKWTASRSECFLSDYQGRDLAVQAELALDKEGNFLALRGVNTSNLGAYTIYFWPLRKGLSMMQGVYSIPTVHFHGHAAMTNTMPTAVYRSAGRPEAIFVMERLIDLAASQCGFDRVELRRRNLIASEAMPYKNAVGVTYDSGDYAAAMDRAVELADWAGFPARKAGSAKRGLCRGIALANYIEVTSGIPRERAEIIVSPDGSVELALGTASSGQGHETSFAQLVCEWLHVPFEQVRYIANDTDRVSVGGGSHSGRSMRLCGCSSDAGKPAGRSVWRSGGCRRHHQPRRRLPLRRPCLRGGGRSRHRPRPDPDLDRRRRCRLGRQPDDPARPGAWCDCPRAGAGVAGAFALRSRQRATADRLLHGLRHAARRYDPADEHRADRNPCEFAPLRHSPGRGGRNNAGARRCDRRHRRCALRVRRDAHRNAGNAGTGLARHPGRQVAAGAAWLG